MNWRLPLRRYFWLEKPNFHNRRIYSAAWIVVGNLPERQYFSIDGAEYPSVDLLVWIVKSTNYSPLKIRGVPPKAGRCYELIDNWQVIMDNRSGKVGSQKNHNPCTAWRQCLSPYLKGTVRFNGEGKRKDGILGISRLSVIHEGTSIFIYPHDFT